MLEAYDEDLKNVSSRLLLIWLSYYDAYNVALKYVAYEKFHKRQAYLQVLLLRCNKLSCRFRA